MDPALQEESARLENSWAQHAPAHLQSYLVRDVEDPRINLQSIFSRHFLLNQLTGETWAVLMREECRFSAVVNWLLEAARQAGDSEGLAGILHALREGADNAEGLPLPVFVRGTFRDLSSANQPPGAASIPDYIVKFLSDTRLEAGKPQVSEELLNTFRNLWNRALSSTPSQVAKMSVLEPACGSANDYRWLQAYGIAERIAYTGFDLCETNVANARAMFPGVRFRRGNVFEIAAGDGAYDLSYVHDLFEHLSLAGIDAAVRELCRVTRAGICIGFFNMDEIAAHVIQPHEDYHWNTLSVEQMRASFAQHGFACRVRHIGTFLRQEIGCENFHNPGAYTFILWRE